MSYALESETEFDRLERQSEQPGYDYRRELALADLPTLREGARVLDAGCGSGIVTRHLARTHPGCEVIGCDASGLRVQQAKALSAGVPRLRFEHADLGRLEYPDGHFDLIICRYVFQHLPAATRVAALAEFRRCLAPGGKLVVIDFDGVLYNVYPRSPWLDEALEDLEARCPVDLRIGRKLPRLIVEAGFIGVDRSIEVLDLKGELLAQEKVLWSERFATLRPALTEWLGGVERAERFCVEFLAALDVPGAVFFYDKFIVTGTRPGPDAVVRT